MSLKKVSTQLQRKNKIAQSEQIVRTLRPKVIENLKYKFSAKVIAFCLRSTGILERICQGQYVTQLVFKDEKVASMPSLKNFMTGYNKKIGEKFERISKAVLLRKTKLINTMAKEFVIKRVESRLHPTPFDPSFRIIIPYGYSKGAINKFLEDLLNLEERE